MRKTSNAVEQTPGSINIKIIPYELKFKRPTKTSRGVYHTHKIWYVIVSSVSDPSRWGIGECAPLFDLSPDYNEHYEEQLCDICNTVQSSGILDAQALKSYPSMLFGLETAFRHYQCQTAQQKNFQLWDSPFSQGKQGIPINGLIWMGDFSYMLEQIEAKLQAGFRCVKLKIGALNFEEELKLLHHIRSRYSAEQITLRVDANGAFAPQDAPEKLKRLAALDLHSIEQPIPAGQWAEMAKLTQSVPQIPLPIALDEELIGIHDLQTKQQLLETIRPQYIILKPTLHGGITGSQEWIDLANALNIGWWVTSALESNIGLNAIAQWCATLGNPQPQGLGTGALYSNNIDMPLTIEQDCLWFNPNAQNHLAAVQKQCKLVNLL